MQCPRLRKRPHKSLGNTGTDDSDDWNRQETLRKEGKVPGRIEAALSSRPIRTNAGLSETRSALPATSPDRVISTFSFASPDYLQMTG